MFATCYRLLLLISWIAVSGCAMCSNCEEETYAASGGVWERVDPIFGRVGSAFTPEVGVHVDDYADGMETIEDGTGTEIIPPGEPTPAGDPPPATETPPATEAPPTTETPPATDASPSTESEPMRPSDAPAAPKENVTPPDPFLVDPFPEKPGP